MKPLDIVIRAKDQTSTVVDGVSGRLKALAALVASYFGVKAFAGAVASAADLEAALSSVKAVSGATKQEMVDLRRAAEGAGSSTKFTATESALAMGDLARAGLNVKDTIAALPAVLALAEAGGLELGQSAEIVTKTISGMGLAFQDSGRVADILAKGADASNTSVLGLAQALSYAAPVAKSLKLPLELVVGLIGKLADAGIDASRAGTALNSIFSQFSDPASKFRQELAAAGIITNDFEAALRQLAAAGPLGQRAILAVGQEAGPALRSLLNQGMGALDDLVGKLRDADGAAAETADTMGDNLRGAMARLHSMWTTVKDVLGTPVLPVLTGGVRQLTGALREAVANGTVGRWGEAIRAALEGGIAWARRFIQTVDVDAITARLQGWAGQAQEAFDRIGRYASNAGDVVKTAYGVMSTGAHAVLMSIYGVAMAYTESAAVVVKGALTMTQALEKVAFGSAKERLQEDANRLAEILGGLTATSDAFGERARQSFLDMASGAQMAREGWAGLTADQEQAQTQARASAQAMGSLAETLREVGGATDAVGQKAQANAILQTEATKAAVAAASELKREYEAALAAGNVQLALEKLDAMRGALHATSSQAKATAQDVENAFTRLGVTSSAELARARDAAVRDFNIIRQAGTSTAQDKAAAWKVMAEAVIAANKGVATETIKAQASQHGLRIESDETGRSVIKAMNQAAAATDQVRKAADGTAAAYRHMASAASSAASASRQAQGLSDQAYDPYARPGDPLNDRLADQERANRLRGQTGAVDNSGMFTARDKLRAGTLTEADIPLLESVVAAIKANSKVASTHWQGGSLAGQNDQREWDNVALQLSDALLRLQAQKGRQDAGAAAPATAPAAPIYATNIYLPSGQVRQLNMADQASVEALRGLLGELESGQGARG